MNNTNELHNASMDRAELALIARMQKDDIKADKLFRESLDLELKAIAAMEMATTIEPTYSILHRSAATLALDCNDPRLAEKLISKALAHDPPAEIVEELRDLLETVYFRRHLLLRGITLEEDELQMSLAGQGVGLGVVHSSEFLNRVEIASKLIYRIVDRRQYKPFRTHGRLKKSVKDDYELFLSVPRAASFAVTLKLGRPMSQQKLPGISDTSDIVDEFMELMTLVNKAKYKEIEDWIPDQTYRTNFVQLAKRLAPDGENVKLVGFTSMRQGKERFVEVVRPKSDIGLPEVEVQIQNILPDKITIKGALLFADATHQGNEVIKLVDQATDKSYLVMVPEGMMDDIVKPLWRSTVVIKGTQKGRYIMLEDIDEQ